MLYELAITNVCIYYVNHQNVSKIVKKIKPNYIFIVYDIYLLCNYSGTLHTIVLYQYTYYFYFGEQYNSMLNYIMTTQ